jgi:hypothetical protein
MEHLSNTFMIDFNSACQIRPTNRIAAALDCPTRPTPAIGPAEQWD